jgi:hypothetical protein
MMCTSEVRRTAQSRLHIYTDGTYEVGLDVAHSTTQVSAVDKVQRVEAVACHLPVHLLEFQHQQRSARTLYDSATVFVLAVHKAQYASGSQAPLAVLVVVYLVQESNGNLTRPIRYKPIWNAKTTGSSGYTAVRNIHAFDIESQIQTTCQILVQA